MTGIHGFESEDVSEKQSIRLGVFGVHNYMSGRIHFRPSITSDPVADFCDGLLANGAVQLERMITSRMNADTGRQN
jgi:hypothetical protein